MKRIYSLKSRESYKFIFLNGKKIRGKGNIIFFIKNSSLNDIKIGIAIDKKLGNAVKRNWIKRRIRAVCTDLIIQMNRGFLIIIKPVPENVMMNFEDLKSELVMLFKKAGALNGSN
ncbi:MAG: ribonuclease P protein component [Spirochaetes bacterium]|nr:ribonuclease P protein component [Spirochaetota bacterium]